MAEQLIPHHEQQHHHEVEPKHEAATHKEHEPGHHKEQAEHDQEQIKSIENKAKAEAKSSTETKVDNKDVKQAHSHLVGKELKNQAFKRSIARTRKQLSAPDRVFSKVIHQPVVDALSKVGEKTIARPKGLLVGSILALAGSSWLLYNTKHYGYHYNYLVVLILFGGGYLLGLVIELLWFSLRRSPK